MKPILFAGLFLFGVVGVWLALWDLIDYLTTGFNTGIWDVSIVTSGYPSILAGVLIVAIVMILGVKVLFK